MITQKFNGKKYTLYDGERYLSRGNKRLHREVWKYYYGDIPEGCHIHHIDGNPLNNDIKNLQCLNGKEHLQYHSSIMTEEHKRWLRNNLNNNARPKAVEWHKSENGRCWHTQNYENVKDKLHQTQTFVCKQCGTEYTGTVNGHNSFCSSKCKAKYRRQSGVDNIKRICEYCEKEFIVNRYSKTRYCCQSCSTKARWERNR